MFIRWEEKIQLSWALSCWLYHEAKKSFDYWCLSLRFGGVYWVQVVMEYLVIAFVPCVIINMLYGIKSDKMYMWALKRVCVKTVRQSP